MWTPLWRRSRRPWVRRSASTANRPLNNPPLERTAAAVYFSCGRASLVRRRGRSTASRYPPMLLVRDIAAAAEATDWMSLDMVRTLTHVRGKRNRHLADPDGYDSRTGNYQQRRT